MKSQLHKYIIIYNSTSKLTRFYYIYIQKFYYQFELTKVISVPCMWATGFKYFDLTVCTCQSKYLNPVAYIQGTDITFIGSN